MNIFSREPCTRKREYEKYTLEYSINDSSTLFLCVNPIAVVLRVFVCESMVENKEMTTTAKTGDWTHLEAETFYLDFITLRDIRDRQKKEEFHHHRRGERDSYKNYKAN